LFNYPGKCPVHYSIQQKLDHYSEFVTESGCQLWLGGLTSFGYGCIQYQKKQQMAHRVSFSVHHSVVLTPKQLILHQCDVPACINPHHLRIGTHFDNTLDMIRRNRMRPGQIYHLLLDGIITYTDYSELVERYYRGHPNEKPYC
jgi:hypothetical protein